jgi:hypothetical protein
MKLQNISYYLCEKNFILIFAYLKNIRFKYLSKDYSFTLSII